MNQMPPITKNLLIINILFFLACQVLPSHGVDLENIMGLHFFMAEGFHPWQLFTYMFIHGGWQHIFFNMFALWMFGRIIEQTLGPKRFLTLFVVCGIGAGLCQEIVQYVHYLQLDIFPYDYNNMIDGVLYKGTHDSILMEDIYHEMRPFPVQMVLNLWSTVGASGAVYGILLAFGMLFPNDKMFIIPIPVPIKAKYLIAAYAVIEVLSALSSRGDGIAHMAHIGGMIFAFFLILYWRHTDRKNDRWGGGYYMH